VRFPRVIARDTSTARTNRSLAQDSDALNEVAASRVLGFVPCLILSTCREIFVHNFLSTWRLGPCSLSQCEKFRVLIGKYPANFDFARWDLAGIRIPYSKGRFAFVSCRSASSTDDPSLLKCSFRVRLPLQLHARVSSRAQKIERRECPDKTCPSVPYYRLLLSSSISNSKPTNFFPPVQRSSLYRA